MLPALTCARAIGNLWSIYLGVNILIRIAKSEGLPLPLCCLLKPRTFSTISTILFGFSFSGILFLLIAFNESINSSLTLITNCYFLDCLAVLKYFAKHNGLRYLIQFQNISSLIYFLSTIISFINSCHNFNLDFFYLVGSVASSGVGLSAFKVIKNLYSCTK